MENREEIVSNILSIIKNSHERTENDKSSIFQNNILIAEIGKKLKITKEFMIQILKMNGAHINFDSKLLRYNNYNANVSKYITSKYINCEDINSLLLTHEKVSSNLPLALDLSTIESIFICNENARIFDVDCKSYEDKQYILLNLVSFNKVYTIILNQNLHEDDSLRLEMCSTLLKVIRDKEEKEFEILM